MSEDNLDAWRQAVDQIDHTLLEQLAKRQEVVSKIMQWKHQKNKPVFDSKREEQMLSVLRAKAKKLNLNPDFVVELYQTILTHSKLPQE